MRIHGIGKISSLLADELARRIPRSAQSAVDQPSSQEEPEKPKGPWPVPESKMAWLTKRVEQLNKVISQINSKGAEFGLTEPLQPITVKVVGDEQIKTRKKGVFIPAKLVAIEGSAPKIKDWTFVASILPLTGDDGRPMNLIKAVPGEGPIPEEYRREVPKCDYCKQPRRRNETFLVRDQKGEFKQIGRNCLAKFLGTESPEVAAGLASALADLLSTVEVLGGTDAWDDEYGGAGERRERTVDIGTFVSIVIGLIRAAGWTPRSKADLSKLGATADLAWRWLVERDGEEQVRKILPKDFESRPEDEDLAAKAIEWARELKNQAPEALDDYLWNLTAAASQNVVSHQTSGIVASLVNAYQRATAPVDTSAAGKPMFFRGKVVESKRTKTGSTLWAFQNERGEKVIWFDNKHELDDKLLEAREKDIPVQFEAMVQKVSSYMGQQQTQVVVKRLVTDEEFFEGAKVAEEQARKAEELKGSASPLAPGQKTRLKLTVLEVKTFEAYREGSLPVSLFKFVDEFGRKFFWKTSTQQEMAQGSTYDCNVTVGWEKEPGLNKPVLDEHGNKRLAVDKYSPDTIKLEKVDPVAVEGKAMISKEDLARKKKEVAALEGAHNKLSEQISEIVDKMRGYDAHGAARGLVPYGEKDVNVAQAQEDIAALQAEIDRAMQAKAQGQADFQPNKENIKTYLLASQLEALKTRPATAEEVVREGEKDLSRTQDAINRVKAEIAPPLESMAARIREAEKADGYEAASKVRAQFWPEVKALVDKLNALVKDLPLSGIPYTGRLEGEYAFAFDRFVESLRDIRPDASLMSEVEVARNSMETGDIPDYLSSRRMMPQALPPDKFIEMARRAIATTHEGIKAVPAMQAEVLRLRQQAEEAGNVARKAMEELEDMKGQRSRGVAMAWVMRSCKFAYKET